MKPFLEAKSGSLLEYRAEGEGELKVMKVEFWISILDTSLRPALCAPLGRQQLEMLSSQMPRSWRI